MDGGPQSSVVDGAVETCEGIIQQLGLKSEIHREVPREPSLGPRTLAGILVLGVLVRAIPVLRGGGLTGDLGYDDGAYYAAAVGFVHGLLPYRDFLFVQPPGIVLLLSPFAALGTLTSDATGMAVARAAFILLGALNGVLVAVVAGRYRPRAGLVAGVLYAIWYSAAGFEKTTLLVPAQSALLLGSVLLLGGSEPAGERSPRWSRAFLAGVLAGLVVAIQLWGVVPLVILGIWLVWRERRSSRSSARIPAAFGLGAAVSIAAVNLPFLVSSGAAMVRYVVLDQVGRPDIGISILTRLRDLEGLRRGGPPILVDAGILAVALVGLMGAIWVARRVPAMRIWVVLAAVQGGLLLWLPVFFPHYAAWAAPAVAIVIGTAAAELWKAGARTRNGLLVARVATTIVIVALLVPSLPRSGTRLQLPALTADVALSRCVASDEPSLLVLTGALARDVANGCVVVIDPTAVAYDTDRGKLAAGDVGRSRVNAPGYQQAMLDDYGRADAAFFVDRPSDGLDAATWAGIRCALPVVRNVGPVLVLLAESSGAAACPG